MNSNISEANNDNFVDLVVKGSDTIPVVVDFWAPWCSPCKQLTPIIENAVNSFPDKLKLVKINIDENQNIAAQMQVQSIPMVYAFFKGQVVDGFQGNIPESQVLEFIKKISELAGPSPEIKDLLDKLEILINEANWEKALETANYVLDLDQGNIEACFSKVISLISLKNFSDAKQFLSILPDEVLNNKKIQGLAAKIEIAEESLYASKDVSVLKEKLKNNPLDIQVHIDLSNAFFGLGKISDCYNLLIEAIKIDPKWNNEEARKKLLSFIVSHDLNSEEAKIARRKLSSILFN